MWLIFTSMINVSLHFSGQPCIVQPCIQGNQSYYNTFITAFLKSIVGRLSIKPLQKKIISFVLSIHFSPFPTKVFVTHSLDSKVACSGKLFLNLPVTGWVDTLIKSTSQFVNMSPVIQTRMIFVLIITDNKHSFSKTLCHDRTKRSRSHFLLIHGHRILSMKEVKKRK